MGDGRKKEGDTERSFPLFLLRSSSCSVRLEGGPSRIAAARSGLPAEEPFFAAVRENMARANREQYRYAYKERRTELHTNPFGRLGTGDVVVYDVTPGSEPSVTFRKLLEKDGKPVLDSKPERAGAEGAPRGTVDGGRYRGDTPVCD